MKITSPLKISSTAILVSQVFFNIAFAEPVSIIGNHSSKLIFNNLNEEVKDILHIDSTNAIKFYRRVNDKESIRLKQLDCNKTATTSLFDVKLKCASFDDLVSAVKETGASVKIYLKDYISFDASRLLRDAKHLSISSTRNNEFSSAQYLFPGNKTGDLVLRLKEMIQGKYGKPVSSRGDPFISSQKFSYIWNLRDGIKLELCGDATATTLTYKHPENHQKRSEEKKSGWLKLEQKIRHLQDRAF